MINKKKEASFDINVTPVDDKTPITDPIINKEQEGNNIDALLIQIQDLADMIRGLNDRISQIEGEPSTVEPVVAPIIDPSVEPVIVPEGDIDLLDEEALGDAPSPETPNPMVPGVEPTTIAGVPEKPVGEPSTTGDAAIAKQTDTGTSPEAGDDLNASSKVPKPEEELPKPTVTTNACDPEEDKVLEESYIDKTLRELKEKVQKQENNKLIEEDFSHLLSKQTVVAQEKTKDNEFVATKEKTNSVIKEYLQKAGIFNRFN